MEKIKLAIFASGEGSNALQLIHYFEKNSWMEVALVVSNNKNSALLPKAEHAGIEVLFQTNEEVSQGESLTHRLNQKGIDWIVLAGFLRKIPSALLRAYPTTLLISIRPYYQSLEARVCMVCTCTGR